MDGDKGEAHILDEAEIISLAPYTDTADEPAAPRDESEAPNLDFNINYDNLDDEDDDDPVINPNPRSTWTVLRIALVASCVVVLFAGFFLLFLRKVHVRHNEHISTNRPKPKPKSSPKAVNWVLDFPSLYPPIVSESTQCQSAWAALSSVPCHEKIFNRGWDAGKHLSFFEPDPMRYVPQLCEPKCKSALESAFESVTAACSDGASFDIEGYEGMFNTTFLEAGPVEAVGVLLHRNTHTCRNSEVGDSEYGSCMIELNERFYILDGINFGSLEGIDAFLRKTKRPSRERGGWKSGTIGSSTDGGWKKTYRFKAPERTYGPGIGSTSCGWCMLSWFENHLNGWDDGSVISPDSGLPVSLPEYIRRIKEAGQRCKATEWNRIYGQAIKNYQDKNLLSEDWEGLPSGDLAFLIRNGPHRGDEPIKTIQSTAAAIRNNHSAFPDIEPYNLQRTLICLDNLAAKIQSLPCYLHLNITTLDPMIKDPNGLLRYYCSSECATAVNQQEPSLRVCMRSDIRSTPIVKPFWDAWGDARKTHANVCVKEERTTQQCAPVLSSLNLTSWAYDGRPSGNAFHHEISQRIAALDATPIPPVVSAAVHKGFGTPEYDALRKELPKWQEELKNSVCAPCIWQWVVGDGSVITPLSYLHQLEKDSASSVEASYLEFAQYMYATCDARGADWLGGIPYGGDDVVWRVKEQDGKVSRYITDQVHVGYMGKESNWRRADEQTGQEGIALHGWGSLWHLRTAIREFKAEQEGVVQQWRKTEVTHRAEEDAKVWGKTAFGYYWLKPEDREREAYSIFTSEVEGEVKEKNPGLKLGKTFCTLSSWNDEIVQKIGKMWKALSAEDLEHYMGLAEEDRRRYAVEKAAFDA
ncbi:uncharacterized protein BDZ99DRAFT_457153 [Mytilinidion resinicola]|uniref:HMG box domain-containing protein n=1 Tax=Mytilinidion resinicola TaxID=574789 RepID=A0A6A6ZB25_9PEZI|nr:uncharacterized protein BDZ99DRAFT_457153 [Mytilinidion resinicola]KAF2817417.1 hypothetical protein BDZ99DRAFT_457153 [Mytilinidion resinicola]